MLRDATAVSLVWVYMVATAAIGGSADGIQLVLAKTRIRFVNLDARGLVGANTKPDFAAAVAIGGAATDREIAKSILGSMPSKVSGIEDAESNTKSRTADTKVPKTQAFLGTLA